MPKVSLVKCQDYDQNRLYSALKQSIDLIGGIEKFVKPGYKVLIKPNLLRPAEPDEAVTTHPEFVRAVVRLVKEKSNQIFVGDSPAGLVKVDAVYDKCGITQVAREENVNLVKFDRITKINGIPFARIIKEVDLCISLPKFKTHNLTIITSAVKNVFGFITGLYKVQCHKNAPNHRVFSKFLAKVYSIAKPQLNIIDAIDAMDGDGPSGGTRYHLGLIVASEDAVAADAVLSKIIGIKPDTVMTTKQAHQLGLGQADLDKIDVVGEDINRIGVDNFKLPRIAWIFRMPNIIARVLLKLMPLIMGIDRHKCSQCLACKQICPEQAIKKVNNNLKIDFQRCILCFCCGEICPQNAIYIRFLNRRIRG